ncbi:MAG: MazG-like family protein [Candidatus Diapherotrites archaeon]|nr:MazG-like family protein [Candidatus Diapherotrites archaeon]
MTGKDEGGLMQIREAQETVKKHLKEIGYDKIETTPSQAFLHLIEETGEVARILLHQETNRSSLPSTSKHSELNDEIADVFWQTLKLASYLDIDLEESFIKKYEKNKLKKEIISEK